MRPTTIAVLASMGIHGLVAIAFPDVTLIQSPEKRRLQRTVRLISIEQNRLPNLSQSYSKVPAVPKIQQTGTFLFDTVARPTSSQSVSKAVVPSPPTNRRVQQILELPSKKKKSPPNFILRPSPIQENQQSRKIPTGANRPIALEGSEQPISRSRSEQEERKKKLAIQSSSSEGVIIAPRIRAERQSPADINNYPPPSIIGETIKPEDFLSSQLPQERTTEPEIVVLPSTLPDNAYLPPHRSNFWADILARANNLTLDLTNTTSSEEQENYINWLAKIEIVEAEDLSIEGNYPLDACPLKLEGTTVYGVLVNGKGQIRELDLIRSGGYGIFNQQAKEDILTRRFDYDIPQSKAYRVSVNFAYNQQICPSLTLPGLEEGAALPETITPPAPPPLSTKTKETQEPEEALGVPLEPITEQSSVEVPMEPDEALEVPLESIPKQFEK